MLCASMKPRENLINLLQSSARQCKIQACKRKLAATCKACCMSLLWGGERKRFGAASLQDSKPTSNVPRRGRLGAGYDAWKGGWHQTLHPRRRYMQAKLSKEKARSQPPMSSDSDVASRRSWACRLSSLERKRQPSNPPMHMHAKKDARDEKRKKRRKTPSSPSSFSSSLEKMSPILISNLLNVFLYPF